MSATVSSPVILHDPQPQDGGLTALGGEGRAWLIGGAEWLVVAGAADAEQALGAVREARAAGLRVDLVVVEQSGAAALADALEPLSRSARHVAVLESVGAGLADAVRAALPALPVIPAHDAMHLLQVLRTTPRCC